MLRAWRDRAVPTTPDHALTGRRAPGLRREEVAARSGLSVDYLTRLEQGRAAHPSSQVLAALARTLLLSTAERDHLYRLAQLTPPTSGVIDSHVTPSIQRMTERLRDVPVAVYDAAWTLVTCNDLFAALMGEVAGATGRARNLPWRHFTGARGRVVRDDDSEGSFESEMVADLRAATSRYPRDAGLHTLIAELREASPRFDDLWRRGDVAVRVSESKNIMHPEVGELTLDCDVLTAQGSDLRIVAYSAPEGSESAEKLRLLAVIGSGVSGASSPAHVAQHD